MNHSSFAMLSRRAALLAGGVAASTSLAVRFARAKKKRSTRKLKKAKKACQQDLDVCLAQKAICADQVEACTTAIEFICTNNPEDPDCLENRFCCPLIEDCDFPEFINCLAILG